MTEVDPITLVVAISDAAFDGRELDKLGRADRERYLARAAAGRKAARDAEVERGPSLGLLMSIAICGDHALGMPGYYDQLLISAANDGVTHARHQEVALQNASKAWAEIMGVGFYRPDRDGWYVERQKFGEMTPAERNSSADWHAGPGKVSP